MNIKRISFIALALATTFYGTHVQSQTSQQDKKAELPSAAYVVRMHLNSMGGRAALENVRNMTTKATVFVRTPFGDLTMNMTNVESGNKSLSITKSDKIGEMKQGSNGQVFWLENPTVGAKIIDGPEKASMQEQLGTMFPVLGWNNFPGTITVVGREKIAGVDCFKVDFVPAKGPTTTRFFETETGRVAQILTERQGAKVSTGIRVVPSDYRKVNGITMPFKQSSFFPDPRTNKETEMITQIIDVQINTKLDESVFALPASIQKFLDANKK